MSVVARTVKRLHTGQSGIAGEYYVAGELCRLGHIASMTIKNARGIDVHVSNQEGTRTVAIQVKTTQDHKKEWLLGRSAETRISDTLFYVFVNLTGSEKKPEFHIVPSKIVADAIRTGHAKWLKALRRDGNPHKDSDIRCFGDPENKYKNQWELLGL